jgi:periplasmic copper chaperone A
MSLRTLLAAVAALAFLAVPALAHEVTVGSLEITDLWTRATPPKAPTGGGYLTITNKGTAPDRLIAVSSPLAGTTQIHKMAMENGVMTMRPVEGGLEIPAGGSITLAPDGFHIMFMGLKGGFKEGDKLPVTLTFEKAGSVDTFLHILGIGASGPTSDADGGMGSMKMGN